MQVDHNGWEASASAWIADMGEFGDYARQYVLDTPMLGRIHGRGFRNALDVGCGEGRFCRLMQVAGITTVGIEPTHKLLEAAIARDQKGIYLNARAEKLPLEDDSFDLVVSYLTLIDIDGIDDAIGEMARVMKPGGSLLIANLNSFNTAGRWRKQEVGSKEFVLDDYLTERAEWVSWRGISIRNWHRPFSRYMNLLFSAGLRLVYFDEPEPIGGEAEVAEHCRRIPYFHLMEWCKS